MKIIIVTIPSVKYIYGCIQRNEKKKKQGRK